MINKKIRKAMVMTTVTAMMAATMLTVGCGNGNYTSKSVTNTDITTVQDSAGNDYEVSHIIKNVNGNKSESYESVPLEIHNETPVNISGVYIAPVNSNEWGDNWMLDREGNECVVEPGHQAYGNMINYTLNDPMFKVKVDTVDGKSVDFTNLDISKVEDPEHITLTISAEKGKDVITATFR